MGESYGALGWAADKRKHNSCQIFLRNIKIA